jgi:hypothetical protein
MYGIWFSGEGMVRLQSTDFFKHSHWAIDKARDVFKNLGSAYTLAEVYDVDSGDIVWIEERPFILA